MEIAENVYWVGAIDWDLRDFHGYSTPNGTTYNSYLIKDELNVLVDTVKHTHVGELLERMSSIMDPEDLDLIVCNHVERDHSSGLPTVQKVTGARVVASKQGVGGLELHYPDLQVEPAPYELDIGDRSLSFHETRMLHWPDSMFTFMPEEGILFSMDAFGQHLASSNRFDDQVDRALLMREAATYYANILLRFGKQVGSALELAEQLGPRMLATAHGLIWRDGVDDIIEAYARWSNHETRSEAVVVYDTMWGSTRIMATHIAEGLRQAGVPVSMLRIRDTGRAEIMRQVLEAGAVLIGSPTMNATMFPSVADLLYYMKGLRPMGRLGAAFGSMGWSGGAVEEMRELMASAGLVLFQDDLERRYATESDAQACEEFGSAVGKALLQRQS